MDLTFLVLTLMAAATVGGEPGLTDHAVQTDVYVLKPHKLLTASRQKERALMLRLKNKPSSAATSTPKDRIDAAEWLDSLLHGVYHPLDDKGSVVEDVPETRLGVQPERERIRPGSGSKKRLNLKKPTELDRQFVYRPVNMGQLRLEQPVRLERPLPPPAAFRHRDNFRDSVRRPPRLRNQQQSSFRDDFNAPLNHRPSFQQSNNYNNNQQQQDYDSNQGLNYEQEQNFNSQQQSYDNNQRPNYQQQQNFNQQRPNYQQQQSFNNQQQNYDNNQRPNYQQQNNQRPTYEVQIYTNPGNNQQQDDYQQDTSQQDSSQEQDYNNNNQQQSDYQQGNDNQQQDYQQSDDGNQYNETQNNDPYSSSQQQDPYRPPENDNFSSVNNNYNQQQNAQNRPPGRQYVFNVDVYLNQQRKRRNRPLRSPRPPYERYERFRHSFRPVKK